MNTGEIRPSGAHPAFLPLRRSTGTEFSKQLRAQMFAELSGTQATAKPSIGGQQTNSTTNTATTRPASYYQQPAIRLDTPTGDAAYWSDLAKSIGRQYLSPEVADVFARQIQLESAGFDPDVIAGRRVSSAGAEGIAQLMPSSYPNVNRRDPVASLHAAAQTMQSNLQAFGGDVRKALAAYNAGGGRVAQDVSRLGSAWESGLPNETKLYLASILGGTHA